MLSAEKVDEVVRMLEAPAESRLSKRAIAKATGIARDTVDRIAQGVKAVGGPNTSGIYEHCDSCGGRVLMPCRLCALRATMTADLIKRREAKLAAEQAELRRQLRSGQRVA